MCYNRPWLDDRRDRQREPVPQLRQPGFTYATPDTVLAYGDLIRLVVSAIDNVERFAATE